MQVGCIHSVQMSCKSCKIMLFMTVLDIEPCLFVCLFVLRTGHHREMGAIHPVTQVG